MGDERITVIVDTDTRARWEEYIDNNPDADNMSHLLRMSVENYITEDEANEALESEQIDNVEERVETLNKELGQIQDTLQVIKAGQIDEDDMYYLVERAVDGVVDV
jgi:hypothetical protein